MWTVQKIDDYQYGYLLLMQEYLDNCSIFAFTDYDGYGVAVNSDGNLWHESTSPSRAHTIPDGTTHILWFNRL